MRQPSVLFQRKRRRKSPMVRRVWDAFVYSTRTMPLETLLRFSSTRSSTRRSEKQQKKSTSSNSETSAEHKPTVRKASSYRSLLSRLHMSSSELVNTTPSPPQLPYKIVTRIIDRCNPVEQIRMRAVCRTFRDYVDQQTAKVSQLDVRRADISEMAEEPGWIRYYNLLMKIHERRVELIVNKNWTAMDIKKVVGAMAVFRKNLVEVAIDAPIADLLIASLSVIDLDRWYGYQCFMKALDIFDDDGAHFCPTSSKKTCAPTEIYWPRVSSLTVRTTTQQAPHLSRLLDYGVHANYVIDRQVINELKVVLLDSQSPSHVNKNIYNFRCWAGSAGFDERFHLSVDSPQVLN